METSTGPLVFASSDAEIILTCQSAAVGGVVPSYDPTAVFDCQLGKGHTLDGLVRAWMAIQRQLEEIRKSLPTDGGQRRS